MAEKILIVEDSASMRKMLNFTLTERGYEVIETENGKAAMDKINNEYTSKKFTLIITDINMPIMTGIELIEELRKHPIYKFTPIIVLTTKSEEEIKTEDSLAGASAWLVKPFNPETLIETVTKVIG